MFAILLFTTKIPALASLKVYYGLDDGGVDNVWNKSEGYLFLSVVRRGYHFRYLEYPLIALRRYFGSLSPPNDRQSSLTVVEVTATAVQRYVTKNISLDFYTLLITQFTPTDRAACRRNRRIWNLIAVELVEYLESEVGSAQIGFRVADDPPDRREQAPTAGMPQMETSQQQQGVCSQR